MDTATLEKVAPRTRQRSTSRPESLHLSSSNNSSVSLDQIKVKKKKSKMRALLTPDVVSSATGQKPSRVEELNSWGEGSSPSGSLESLESVTRSKSRNSYSTGTTPCKPNIDNNNLMALADVNSKAKLKVRKSQSEVNLRSGIRSRLVSVGKHVRNSFSGGAGKNNSADSGVGTVSVDTELNSLSAPVYGGRRAESVQEGLDKVIGLDDERRSRRGQFSASRNARTAPSTPEAEQRRLPAASTPRHAESASNLMDMAGAARGMKAANGTAGRPDSSQLSKSNGKELPQKRKKSRNEKFHKLFKNIPAEENVLKCYSCAYFSDILLQGHLYISPNYFCFYSKILGHAKFIQISVSQVLNISREKTAIIIPNAIGILTHEDKYVFGSLMSRDNTFKYLWAVWKQVTQPNGVSPDADLTDVSDVNLDIDITDNNNTMKQRLDVTTVAAGNTSGDGEEEEEDEEEDDSSGSSSLDSLCINCAQPVAPADSSTPHVCDGSVQNLTVGNSLMKSSSSTTKAGANSPALPEAPPRNKNRNNISSHHEGGVSLVSSLTQLLPTSPQNILLLCSILVVLLALSAFVMAYKIIILQAKLDSTQSWNSYQPGDKVYSDMYYINDEYHTATIRRFHAVLEANIHVLDQVYSSLKSLENSPLMAGGDCHENKT